MLRGVEEGLLVLSKESKLRKREEYKEEELLTWE